MNDIDNIFFFLRRQKINNNLPLLSFLGPTILSKFKLRMLFYINYMNFLLKNQRPVVH